MVSYRIQKEARLQCVKRLWSRFFKKDPQWHFVLEGDYFEIRLSDYNKEMEDYLNWKGWKYIKQRYVDNICITKKYQKYFEKIFHGYADLVMHAKKSDEEYVIERGVHLLFNLFSYSQLEEAKWLSRYVPERAMLHGRHIGFTEAKELFADGKL